MKQAREPTEPGVGAVDGAAPSGARISFAVVEALRNAAWLTFGHVGVLALSVLVSVWVARYLQPIGLGKLSFALSFSLIAAPFVQLGLGEVLTRELVRRPANAAGLLGAAAGLRLVAGVIGVVAVVGAAVWLRPGDRSMHILVGVCGLSLLVVAPMTAEFWFHAQVRSRYPVVARMWGQIGGAAGRVVGILLQAPVVVFAALFTLTAAAEAAILVVLYRRRAGGVGPLRFSAAHAGSLARDAWPLAMSAVAVSIYMRIDQVMIGSLIDDDHVGLYAAGVVLADAANFLPVVVAQSVLPALVRLRQISRPLYFRRIQQLCDIFTWLGIAAALALSLGAPWIVRLAYGPAYLDAVPALRVLAWATVFVFQGVILGPWILAENRQLARGLGQLLAAAGNVGLNFLLIPRMGIIGAAWATLIAYALSVAAPLIVVPSMRIGGLHLLRAYAWPARLLLGGLGARKA